MVRMGTLGAIVNPSSMRKVKDRFPLIGWGLAPDANYVMGWDTVESLLDLRCNLAILFRRKSYRHSRHCLRRELILIEFYLNRLF